MKSLRKTALPLADLLLALLVFTAVLLISTTSSGSRSLQESSKSTEGFSTLMAARAVRRNREEGAGYSFTNVSIIDFRRDACVMPA